MTITPDPITEIADQFDCLLRAEIGEANYWTVIERNEPEPRPGICHSHDFCDANQIMIDAFENIVGHAPNCGTDEASAPDMDAINEAWNEWRNTERVNVNTKERGRA